MVGTTIVPLFIKVFPRFLGRTSELQYSLDGVGPSSGNHPDCAKHCKNPIMEKMTQKHLESFVNDSLGPPNAISKNVDHLGGRSGSSRPFVSCGLSRKSLFTCHDQRTPQQPTSSAPRNRKAASSLQQYHELCQGRFTRISLTINYYLIIGPNTNPRVSASCHD